LQHNRGISSSHYSIAKFWQTCEVSSCHYSIAKLQQNRGISSSHYSIAKLQHNRGISSSHYSIAKFWQTCEVSSCHYSIAKFWQTCEILSCHYSIAKLQQNRGISYCLSIQHCQNRSRLVRCHTTIRTFPNCGTPAVRHTVLPALPTQTFLQSIKISALRQFARNIKHTECVTSASKFTSTKFTAAAKYKKTLKQEFAVY